MKKIYLVINCFITAFISNAQQPTLDWFKNAGGSGDDFGAAIVTDDSGFVYATGFFNGTSDFDPGSTVVNLTSKGAYDAFITKSDAKGKLIWARNIGGSSYDFGFAIVVDKTGNVFVTGGFSGTADFDPGAGKSNLVSAGSSDFYILKLDRQGSFVWAKSIGGASYDMAKAIAADKAGNIIVTGTFEEDVDFNPGTGINILSSSTLDDIFILKLDASGNFIWANGMGGVNDDGVYGMKTDAQDNIYSTGFFNGTADFNPGKDTFNLISSGDDDMFIQKLDASGSLIWAKQVGGLSGDYGQAIDIDPSGNVLVAGSFAETVDFDPGAGFSNMAAEGEGDGFILKLDANGNYVWAKRMGGTLDDLCTAIVTDKKGDIYTIGIFTGKANFNPGTSNFSLTSIGDEDVFIAKLEATGNFVWAKQTGGTDVDEGRGITVDAMGDIYAVGYFFGGTTYDPGIGKNSLTGAGGADVFMLKLKQDGNSSVVQPGTFVFTIYPNPGRGIFNVQILQPEADIVIEIYNSLGQQVFVKKGAESINSIDLTKETDGLYVVKVINGNMTNTRKIMKY